MIGAAALWAAVPARVKLVGALLVLAVAVISFARWDAARDARRDLENEANRARFDHIDGAKKERKEIETLESDDLRKFLLERLRGNSDD